MTARSTVTVLDVVKAWWPSPTERQEVEIWMLTRAGVTAKDADFALDALGRAHRVMDEWAYFRTTAFCRAAERIENR